MLKFTGLTEINFEQPVFSLSKMLVLNNYICFIKHASFKGTSNLKNNVKENFS